jgi:gliding motility-associated lipoprotein GldH
MKNVKCKTIGSSLLNFTFYLLPFTLILLLPSCNREKILFSELAEIGADGWAHNDSIRFAFAATDTSQTYDLRLEITHDVDYASENVYVRIRTEFPGDSVKTDILSLELSDGVGAWEGRCGGGDKCRLTIPLQRSLKFPVQGDYALTFVQYTRQDVLPGIYGLKLTVVEVERQNGRTAER